MATKSSTDAYLDLAVAVLRKKRWPLTARQILSHAAQAGIMPVHLTGRTQHKTLNARISEHIREHADPNKPALIYRVAPATYFLTEFQNSLDTPARYRIPYRGFLRYKQVRLEHVLVCSIVALNDHHLTGFAPFAAELFSPTLAKEFRFMERKQANKRQDVKQFISYNLVYRDNLMLTYRRGRFTTVSNELKGSRSIGFGGHLNETDFDLFSDLRGAMTNGAAREMYEELGVDDISSQENGGHTNFQLLGLINIDETVDARKNVAIVSVYRPRADTELRKREMSINGVAWLDMRSEIDYEQFEPWSRLLLQAIQSQQLRLEELFWGSNW
jgi:predicted NUDIX family phosphoesterase